MVCVIQTDSNKFTDMADGATHAGLAFDQGQLVRIEFGQLCQGFVAELIWRHIVDDFAQVAQFAVCINQTWFFFTRLAVTNEFHGCSPFKKQWMVALFVSFKSSCRHRPYRHYPWQRPIHQTLKR